MGFDKNSRKTDMGGASCILYAPNRMRCDGILYYWVWFLPYIEINSVFTVRCMNISYVHLKDNLSFCSSIS